MIPRVNPLTRLWLALYVSVALRAHRLSRRVHIVSDPLCSRFDERTYAVNSARGSECPACASRRRSDALMKEFLEGLAERHEGKP